jgi:hypothetical protein
MTPILKKITTSHLPVPTSSHPLQIKEGKRQRNKTNKKKKTQSKVVRYPGGREIYTGSTGWGSELLKPQKHTKKDSQNRTRNTKRNKLDHQAIWRSGSPREGWGG